MGGGVVDISGKRFGRLVAIKEVGRSSNSRVVWECLCDCGIVKNIIGCLLRNGNTKSCGCLQVEKAKARLLKHGETIGGLKGVEYSAWLAMKRRCYNSKNPDYKNYGGRGIRVCGRWVDSFSNFLEDMGKRPSRRHSLDRYPNVDGDYEPSNCRWATDSEQQKNRTNNRWFEVDGVRMIKADWARKLNMSPSNLSNRLKSKTIEQLVMKKLSK